MLQNLQSLLVFFLLSFVAISLILVSVDCKFANLYNFETIHKHAAEWERYIHIYTKFTQNFGDCFVSCSHLHHSNYSSWYCRTCFASIFFCFALLCCSASLFQCALCRLGKLEPTIFAFFTLNNSTKSTLISCTVFHLLSIKCLQ